MNRLSRPLAASAAILAISLLASGGSSGSGSGSTSSARKSASASFSLNTPVTDSVGQFSVDMPQTPKKTSTPRTQSGTTVTEVNYTAASTDSNQNYFFEISYMVLPGSIQQAVSSDVSGMLSQAITSFASSISQGQATVTHETSGTFQGSPSETAIIPGSAGAFKVASVYRNGILYLISAANASGSADSAFNTFIATLKFAS
jgi:hypothetical protein